MFKLVHSAVVQADEGGEAAVFRDLHVPVQYTSVKLGITRIIGNERLLTRCLDAPRRDGIPLTRVIGHRSTHTIFEDVEPKP
jgi:hypothetical protein